MFDDFVKFTQTYSSYTSTIKELHIALKKLNFLQKVYYTLKGTYCTGLQKRIHYLYHELNTLKDETISGMPVIRDSSLSTHQAHMDEYTALQDTYQAHLPLLSQAVVRRLDVYHERSHNNCMEFVGKSYSLNNNVMNNTLTKAAKKKCYSSTSRQAYPMKKNQSTLALLRQFADYQYI